MGGYGCGCGSGCAQVLSGGRSARPFVCMCRCDAAPAELLCVCLIPLQLPFLVPCQRALDARFCPLAVPCRTASPLQRPEQDDWLHQHKVGLCSSGGQQRRHRFHGQRRELSGSAATGGVVGVSLPRPPPCSSSRSPPRCPFPARRCCCSLIPCVLHIPHLSLPLAPTGQRCPNCTLCAALHQCAPCQVAGVCYV